MNALIGSQDEVISQNKLLLQNSLTSLVAKVMGRNQNWEDSKKDVKSRLKYF